MSEQVTEAKLREALSTLLNGYTMGSEDRFFMFGTPMPGAEEFEAWTVVRAWVRQDALLEKGLSQP